MTEKVFQEFVFCYRDLMYRFARNLLNDDAEAQDCVQGVMIKLWQQKDKLEEIAALKSYIMSALRNECLNKMSRQHMNCKHLAMAGAQQPTIYSHHPGNMAQLIRSFIAGLPRKQKEVILLRDIEELETTEIASLLNMDENAVRTNLARARQKVRAYLQQIETYEQQQIQ